MKSLIRIFIFLSFTISYAQEAPLEFSEFEKQEKYQGLLEELRCLVCQNQSLADSPAGTAQDLRKIIYNMVDEGESSEAIVDFLVARYGDFVLYNPRLNTSTVLLWFGPFLLLVIALVMAYRYVRQSSAEDVEITDEDRALAEKILNNHSPQDREK